MRIRPCVRGDTWPGGRVFKARKELRVLGMLASLTAALLGTALTAYHTIPVMSALDLLV